MSEVKDLIARQAMAIKGNSNAIAAAEKLEEAARLLRAGAQQPVKDTFMKDKIKSRQDRLERIGAAMAKNKREKFEAPLTKFGWACCSKTETSEAYYTKAKPGYLIVVEGATFTVKYGPGVVQTATHITSLEKYLEKLKNEKK